MTIEMLVTLFVVFVVVGGAAFVLALPFCKPTQTVNDQVALKMAVQAQKIRHAK